MRTRLVIALLLLEAIGNSQRQPIDANTVKTEYSFAVRPGRAPLTIRVEIGATGKIGDALVFQEGAATPTQRFSSCEPDLTMELYKGDEHTVLVDHADFNFDGYEDLKLLQFSHPHLGKSIFCVYLWDERSSRFRYEPEIPMPDPVVHPETKTITTHEEYMGGTWVDSVYVWSGDKTIAIAQWGLRNNAGISGTNANCPWDAWCSKLINGKMQKVAMKSTGCEDTNPEPVKCTPPPPSIYTPKAQRK
jgi:hypothetical protein